jgi:hypothetical protein
MISSRIRIGTSVADPKIFFSDSDPQNFFSDSDMDSDTDSADVPYVLLFSFNLPVTSICDALL